jgi:DNA-binding GntR family transcriptional regulator
VSDSRISQMRAEALVLLRDVMNAQAKWSCPQLCVNFRGSAAPQESSYRIVPVTTVATTPADHRPGPQKRQVLVDGVYDTLLSFLMSGTLAPGDPIGIEWLSRSLEVSPTPIREALARIEGTGLIVREPLRGYRVGPRMSPKEFSDLMEARLLIEPYSAAAACRHRDDALLEELSGILAEMRAAPRARATRSSAPS